MFNIPVKERFLNSIESKSLLANCKKALEQISEFEAIKNKDLYEFTIPELYDIFIKDLKNIVTSKELISIRNSLSKYLMWCLMEAYTHSPISLSDIVTNKDLK